VRYHKLSGETVVRAMLLGDPRAVPCTGGAEDRLSPSRAVKSLKRRHEMRSRSRSPSEFERIPYPYQVAGDDWRGMQEDAS
jgi:hypothetical protein